MKLAITGHRASKLGKIGEEDDWFSDMIYDLRLAFADLGVHFIYEGQADGVDLTAAFAAFQSDIPFEAVVPYAGHQSMMPSDLWKDVWGNAVEAAHNVEILSDSQKYPGHWCMHNRNRYMVDHADEVLAVWNGEESGGTWATVKYARSKNKKIHVFNPVTRRWTFES